MNHDEDQLRDTSRRRRAAALALSGLALACTVTAALLHWGEARPALLTDALGLALLGMAVIKFGTGSVLHWCPWLVAGALVGATAIGALAFAPWSLVAAAAFAGAGLQVNRDNGLRIVTALVQFGMGAALNTILLWALIFNQHQPIPPAEFEALDLRAHELLADVPLHDVWAARLAGTDSALTLQDVRWLLVDGFRHNRNTTFIAVAAIRGIIGTVFGWDDDRCNDSAASFVHRLSESDRSQSLTQPGDSMFVYTFEREAMIEIINCTVHALIVIALERGSEGHTIYWGFYVKPVGWITKFYMALIQPFRQTVVYPSIIEGVEREWEARRAAGR